MNLPLTRITVADDVNGYWRNRSFHNYADYALSEPFRLALTALIELGRCRIWAIMCAEAVWWRCHRRLAPWLAHDGLQRGTMLIVATA